MEENLLQIIRLAKTGDKNTKEAIYFKMEPLLKKTAGKLYDYEYEDAFQELAVALLEGIEKIRFIVNEGQCIKYFVKIIKNKAYKMYVARSKEKELICDEEMDFSRVEDSMSEMEICIAKLFVDEMCKGRSEKQREIVRMSIFDGYSDSEIAKKMNISRQYVSQCKKKIVKEYGRCF